MSKAALVPTLTHDSGEWRLGKQDSWLHRPLILSIVLWSSPMNRDALHIPKYVWIRFRFWPPRAQPQPMHPSAASQLHPSGGWRKQEEKILESLLQLPKGNELPWITETAGTFWDPYRHHKGLHLVHLRRRNGLRNLPNSGETKKMHLNLMSGWPAMNKPTNQSHKDNLPVSCFINLPVRYCFVSVKHCLQLSTTVSIATKDIPILKWGWVKPQTPTDPNKITPA